MDTIGYTHCHCLGLLTKQAVCSRVDSGLKMTFFPAYVNLQGMDKSRDYILMCERSKEIQTVWQHQAGDYFVDDTGYVNCWVPGVVGAPVIKNAFGIESDDNLIRLTKYTWLPRYHQLIELAQDPSVSYRDMTFHFFKWTNKPYAKTETICKKRFPGLEQLWLAFVMEKNFQKWWNKDRWVPV